MAPPARPGVRTRSRTREAWRWVRPPVRAGRHSCGPKGLSSAAPAPGPRLHGGPWRGRRGTARSGLICRARRVPRKPPGRPSQHPAPRARRPTAGVRVGLEGQLPAREGNRSNLSPGPTGSAAPAVTRGSPRAKASRPGNRHSGRPSPRPLPSFPSVYQGSRGPLGAEAGGLSYQVAKMLSTPTQPTVGAPCFSGRPPLSLSHRCSPPCALSTSHTLQGSKGAMELLDASQVHGAQH